MPIETLDDIIEELADGFGIYGCGGEDDDHKNNCDCRVCFEIGTKERILRAVELEKSIARGKIAFDDLPYYLQIHLLNLEEKIEDEMDGLRVKARDDLDEELKKIREGNK